MPHDIQIDAWGKLPRVVWEDKGLQALTHSLKTPALSECVSAFLRNISLLVGLTELPLRAFISGQVSKGITVKAWWLTIGKPWPETQEERNQSPRFQEHLERLRADPYSDHGGGAASHQQVYESSARIDHFYEPLMSAQLVMAWTAFETLAGDLWEAAINTHCPSLVDRAWQGKSIPFTLLKDNEFNLAEKMGTVLRKHFDNPFQSLKGIKKAYQDAFPEGWVSQDAFWNEKDISSTFHIRNLITHRAAKIDKKFRDDCKSDPRIVCPPEDGARFYLDGQLLTELLTGLFSAAKRMIESVDGYIDRNK